MKILVANRGEIACRVMHTLRELGIASVAVCTRPDADAPHVWLADETVDLGEHDRYLNIDTIIGAAQSSGATAIHPGYGFLAESAQFARACREADITFIGPSPEAMEQLGDKRAAHVIAEKVGVPTVPGARDINTLDEARSASAHIGYPLLLKAAGGGGGKGMRLVSDAAEMESAFAGARHEAQSAFGDVRLLIEKYIHPARHIEVQILGDGKRVIALGERECSLQRRYQKVIEESPSPGIAQATRDALRDAAVRIATVAGYANAGTVEFLVGPDGQFYFLEVNTRLQVEHPVTEMLTGIDLVQEQIRIAHGEPLSDPPTARGHAIEARLYAEDPYNGYLPQSGGVLMLEWPSHPCVRIDTGIREGDRVHPFYDPLLAKLVAWGNTRKQATRRLRAGLLESVVLGIKTNQSFLLDILDSEFFAQGETFTSTLSGRQWTEPPPPDCLDDIVAKASTRTPAMSAGAGDVHSPWQSLGRFRMSQ